MKLFPFIYSFLSISLFGYFNYNNGQIVAEEPIWNLERRESSGHLFWCRDSSKVKFRCDVEVMEYVKDPDEHKCYYDTNHTASDKLTNAVVVCATCIAAIAVTVFLPWFLIGSS